MNTVGIGNGKVISPALRAHSPIGWERDGLSQADSAQPDWLEALKKQVGSLRYWIVQIVVHDRRVVQIERTEKIRFDQAGQDGLKH